MLAFFIQFGDSKQWNRFLEQQVKRQNYVENFTPVTCNHDRDTYICPIKDVDFSFDFKQRRQLDMQPISNELDTIISNG